MEKKARFPPAPEPTERGELRVNTPMVFPAMDAIDLEKIGIVNFYWNSDGSLRKYQQGIEFVLYNDGQGDRRRKVNWRALRETFSQRLMVL